MIDRLHNLRDAHADRVLAEIRGTIEEETPPDSPLIEMVDYHLETGGKRLRAILPLAVAEALDRSPEPLIPFGAACELLHNATLVHDDLQDGDATRRGEPSVWSQFGDSRAINLGDAMLHWPMLALDRLECDHETYRSVARRFSRETLRLIDGQEREFALMETEAPTFDAYIDMAAGKTSSLFRLTLAGAVELLDDGSARVDRIDASARHLGILFQMQDDVLDLYGEKGRGEPGADVREGKRSALAVDFLERSESSRTSKLRDILDAPRDATDSEAVEWVAGAYRESGTLDHVLGLIDEHRTRAVDALDDDPALRELVGAVADLFLEPIAHVRRTQSSSLHSADEEAR